MGFPTNLPKPGIAVMFLSLLPQFIRLKWQRWLMGTVLAALALRLATGARR